MRQCAQHGTSPHGHDLKRVTSDELNVRKRAIPIVWSVEHDSMKRSTDEPIDTDSVAVGDLALIKGLSKATLGVDVDEIGRF